eukprot:TRINITY_DN8655_c0_g1_i7.p1 TRINITY_DN8655_c0_g1~~TRINITY_DN8655_c0_g1_i7.p1  ORF type:complete len:252 (+),score=34.26 TRINITY_DN8655_c0_g1_i7:348-1103(+)
MSTAAVNQVIKGMKKKVKKDGETSAQMRVIGAGLPRSGTSSTKQALEMLGFDPVFHMIQIFSQPDRAPVFERALRGEKIDLRQAFLGFGSSLDAPASDLFASMAREWPDAKVLLTVRDSDEDWWRSFSNTVMELQTSNFWWFCVQPLRPLRMQCRLVRTLNDVWTQKYNGIGPHIHAARTAEVLSSIPKDRLLVFNTKEGWVPLCKFLDVPVPDVPFPRVNDTKESLFALCVCNVVWSARSMMYGQKSTTG